MKRIILLVIVMGVFVLALADDVDQWDINTIKLRKQSLFGWNYYNGYNRWFGIKGSGMGLGMGYVGIVFGFNSPINDRVEFFLDSYIYADLNRCVEYGLINPTQWLYWELSLWWGEKKQ
jgi:hypothetical protein